MTPPHPFEDDDTGEDSTVPAAVIEGIEDVAAGRTADGDDLEEALDL